MIHTLQVTRFNRQYVTYVRPAPVVAKTVGTHIVATGHQKRPLNRENVVETTTLVHLSGQLPNLRHELRSPFDAL